MLRVRVPSGKELRVVGTKYPGKVALEKCRTGMGLLSGQTRKRHCCRVDDEWSVDALMTLISVEKTTTPNAEDVATMTMHAEGAEGSLLTA